MRPSEILSQEHRVIEQVLSCLEKLVEESRTKQSLDVSAAQDMIEFFRGFADRCHHGKEEAVFFPAFEAKGYPRAGGPTGVMLQEHERGRELVGGMKKAVDLAGSDPSEALARFSENALAFIPLLRAHIEKEDHCLFAMADDAFTAGEQEKLMEAFENVEKEDMGSGTHERFLEIADRLAKRFDVARAASSAAQGGAGGCAHGSA